MNNENVNNSQISSCAGIQYHYVLTSYIPSSLCEKHPGYDNNQLYWLAVGNIYVLHPLSSSHGLPLQIRNKFNERMCTSLTLLNKSIQGTYIIMNHNTGKG